MGRLSRDELRTLHQITVMRSLDRRRLTSGLNKEIVAGFPVATDPSSQQWNDLSALSDLKFPLRDGSDPLIQWLENAHDALGMQQEADDVERILLRLRSSDSSGSSAGAQSPSPTPTIAQQTTTPIATGAAQTPGWTFGAADRLRRPPPQTPQQTATPPLQTAPHTWKAGAAKIYFSVAPDDRREAAELDKHLASLKRAGTVDVWSRAHATGGADTDALAKQKLAEADIVLLFVSKSFLADDTTFGEAKIALEQRVGATKRVVPLLVKTCTWKNTAFGGLTPLPRSERFIASYSDSDAAYTEVVTSLQAMAEDLLSLKRTNDEDPLMRGSSPLASDEALVGSAISAVFERHNVPKHLYVEPEELRRIRQAVQILGRLLVVEGPSQIGKTTAVVSALRATKLSYTKYDVLVDAERTAFLNLVRQTKIEGRHLVDNTQALSDAEIAQIARRMRAFADEDAPAGKVIVLGYPGTGTRLISAQRDLGGRMDLLPMGRQADERIRALVTKAERLANVRYLSKESIVREAMGSFRLAQEICFDAAAEQIEDVPRRRKDVDTDLGLVRSRIKTTLASEFDEPLLAFVKADKDTQTPGACLTLLWLLAQENGQVSIGSAKLRHEHLRPAFEWIEQGNLARWLADHPEVGVLLQVTAGRLSTQDPRLLYYLKDMNWVELGARAGIVVEFEGGEYRVIPQRPRDPEGGGAAGGAPNAAEAALPPPGAFLRQAPYPFWDPNASKLRDLLVSAFPDKDSAKDLALTSGIALDNWNPNIAPYHAWNSLLEIAAAAGKLPRLIDLVLENERVALYHAAIRELTGR